MGLAEWMEHPPLMPEVWDSNPALSEDTQSPRDSMRSRVDRRISELIVGGRVSTKNLKK